MTLLNLAAVLIPVCPLLHVRKSWNTPSRNLVCFPIHAQPDPSPVVSTIGDPVGGQPEYSVESPV